MKQRGERVDLDIQEFKRRIIMVDFILRSIVIGLVYLSLTNVPVECQLSNYRGSDAEERKELEYYYALTEATKLYLTGNLSQSLSLYLECLKDNPHSAVANYQISKIYLRAGDMEKAENFARAAFNLDSGNKWYAFNFATVLQTEQKNDSALNVYESLVQKGIRDLHLFLVMSALYERIGKSELALDYLKRIEEEYGLSRDVFIRRYLIYQDQGNNKMALKELQHAHMLYPDDQIVMGLLAEGYRAEGQNDSADYYYRVALENGFTNGNLEFSFAEYLMEQGKIDSARIVLLNVLISNEIDEDSKASFIYSLVQDKNKFDLFKPLLDTLSTVFLSRNSEDVKTLSLYADITYRLGEYTKSSPALKELLKINKDNYVVWEHLLYAENFMNSTDSIIKYGKQATLLFKDKPIPFLFLASAYYRKKSYNEALEALKGGLPLADNPYLRFEYYALLAEVYQELNDFRNSEMYFKEALKLDNTNNGVKNNYAYYLALRKKDLKYAKKLSKSTIKDEPENATFLDTYAWILFTMNKRKLARNFIELAIKHMNNGSSEIYNHYGDILITLNEYKLAIDAWRKALDLAENKSDPVIEKKIESALNHLELR
jgi:tetratricopeptide (TPR) repeat protein